MDEIYFNHLLSRFVAGDLGEDEHQVFIDHMQSLPKDQVLEIMEHCGIYLLRESNNDTTANSGHQHVELQQRIEALLDEADSSAAKPHIPSFTPQKYQLWKYAGIAASILLAGIAAYVFFKPAASVSDLPVISKTLPIVPGGNKATLTLADGKKIILSNVANGRLAQQSSFVIQKVRDGELAYDQLAKQTAIDHKSTGLNILTTPKGGKYNIKLSDGSRVWLNAGTTLTFPVSFKGKTREVTVIGEAYFEVAKNKVMPFIVNVNHTQVKVLGTHFNVMGYPDEPAVQTTLLEGSVAVSRDQQTKLICPGQQASIQQGSRAAGMIKVNNVDTAQIIGWKNGKFTFYHERLETVMNKIARWYDVDIDYHGKVTKEEFIGIVPRSKNIADVLHTLELTGLVHFKINERRVTVMK